MRVVFYSFKSHLTENSLRFDTFLKHRRSVHYDTSNINSYFKSLDKKQHKEYPGADLYLDKRAAQN